MRIRRPVVECPVCEGRTRISPEHAGTLVKCSQCREWFDASPERERFPGREANYVLSRVSLGLGGLLLSLSGISTLVQGVGSTTAAALLGGGLVLAGLTILRVRHDLHSALNFGLAFLGSVAVVCSTLALDSEFRSIPVIVTAVLAGLVGFLIGDCFWGELLMALFGRTRYRSWFGNWFDHLDR